VVREPCSNIDFVPTLLAWLDIAPTVKLPGASLLSGIRGKGLEQLAGRPQYATMSAWGSLTDCVIKDGFKHVRVFNPETKELIARRLFDLSADPRETRSLDVNLAISDPLFDQMSGTHGVKFEAEFAETDADVLDRLRTLGYFQ
jgi:arylsulfatase A-like enzyme